MGERAGSGQFWKSGTEALLVQAVVHDYPQQEREGALHYIERVAILSGLIRHEDAAVCVGETLPDLKLGGGLLAEGDKS